MRDGDTDTLIPSARSGRSSLNAVSAHHEEGSAPAT
jgi:hypothetical protein